MEEQLVSFETAKLAKLKGFDFDSSYTYNDDGFLINGFEYDECFNNLEGNIVAVTQSLLQKYLRDKHNIHVNAFFKADIINSTKVIITKTVIEDEWWTTAKFKKWKVVYDESFPIKDEKYDFNIETYNDEKYKVETFTYEQALEAGLQYALTLI